MLLAGEIQVETQCALLARDTRQAVGFLSIDGRSPGSRVVALLPPSRGSAQWCPAWLVAYSCGDSHGFEVLEPRTAFPLSSPLLERRPSVADLGL